MLFFYVLFFWFIVNLENILSSNLKDNNFNLINEFFFCLDSFSTTFTIFYLVLFFLIYDLLLVKILVINTKIGKNYFYLKVRAFTFLFTKLTYSYIISTLKQIKFISLKVVEWVRFISLKKIIIWKPLFKRWSYFGLWSKINNKN